MTQPRNDLETKPSAADSQNKIKFITHKVLEEKDESLSRRIVVIGEHPYYQSSGYNSSLSRVWLPFLGVKGSIPIDISLCAENFNRLAVITSYCEQKGWFIKKTVIGVNSPESNELAWCSFSLNQKRKLDAQSSDENINKIFDRLYLKNDLIISLRLTEPHAWGLNDRITDEPDLRLIYELAGLSEEEIALSKIPLILDDNPELQDDDPDKINEWLKQQGATHLKDILYEPPVSYKKIWNDIAEDSVFKNNIENLRSQTYMREKYMREADNLEIQNELKQTQAILIDYMANYSMTKRFFTGHWNKHHIKKVYEALQNSKLDSAIELATYVRSSVGDDLKPQGSLANRLRFIDHQIISSQEKAKLAYLATLRWEENQAITAPKKTG